MHGSQLAFTSARPMELTRTPSWKLMNSLHVQMNIFPFQNTQCKVHADCLFREAKGNKTKLSLSCVSIPSNCFEITFCSLEIRPMGVPLPLAASAAALCRIEGRAIVQRRVRGAMPRRDFRPSRDVERQATCTFLHGLRPAMVINHTNPKAFVQKVIARQAVEPQLISSR